MRGRTTPAHARQSLASVWLNPQQRRPRGGRTPPRKGVFLAAEERAGRDDGASAHGASRPPILDACELAPDAPARAARSRLPSPRRGDRPRLRGPVVPRRSDSSVREHLRGRRRRGERERKSERASLRCAFRAASSRRSPFHVARSGPLSSLPSCPSTSRSLPYVLLFFTARYLCL